MRMFITSKNKYLSNDMKIFETCSIPLNWSHTKYDDLAVTIFGNIKGAIYSGLHWSDQGKSATCLSSQKGLNVYRCKTA